MFQSNNSNNGISSILGSELKIDGDISVSGDLLIYGKVNGNINCKGTVNSAKDSIVQGNIHAKNAVISGKITGDLIVDLKATLGKGSHLEGNLQASIITIEEGARFDGMCNMVKKEATNKQAQSIHEAKLSSSNEQAG